MNQKTFAVALAEAIGGTSRDAVDVVRQWYVYHGKRHPGLAAIACAKGLTDDPKYFDVDNTVETGAVSADDAVLLHGIVRAFRPRAILEIGTWFGTSAGVMASTDGCEVRTCDRNNVYCTGGPGAERIFYHNLPSSAFLELQVKRGWKAQFAFVDARLRKADPPLLRRVLERGSPIALHDFEPEMKGERNYKMLRHCFKELVLVTPDRMPSTATTLALMISRG